MDQTVYEYELQGGSRSRTVTLEDCDDPEPYSCSRLYEALSLDEHSWWIRGRTSAGWEATNGASERLLTLVVLVVEHRHGIVFVVSPAAKVSAPVPPSRPPSPR